MNSIRKRLPELAALMALSALVAAGSSWGRLHEAVAQHVADAKIHQSNEVLESQMREQKRDRDAFVLQYQQDRREQTRVNMEVLKALGRLEERQ